MPSDNSANTPKHKVLCLHGYDQDGGKLRVMLKPLIEMYHGTIDFVSPTAPHRAHLYHTSGMDPLINPNSPDASKFKAPLTKSGWHSLKNDDPEVVQYLDESIEFLEDFMLKNGPFDGIMGFSQGGLMCAILCSLLEQQRIGSKNGIKHPAIKFAVIFSGYKLVDSAWQYVYAKPIHTPSLHTYSLIDPVMPVHRSIELRNVFVKPAVFTFIGGHFVPRTTYALNKMKEFIDQFIDNEQGL